MKPRIYVQSTRTAPVLGSLAVVVAVLSGLVLAATPPPAQQSRVAFPTRTVARRAVPFLKENMAAMMERDRHTPRDTVRREISFHSPIKKPQSPVVGTAPGVTGPVRVSYVRSKAVTTNGSGHAAFTFSVPAGAGGISSRQFITATTTDLAGNTSEYSQVRQSTAVSAPASTLVASVVLQWQRRVRAMMLQLTPSH